ILLTSMDRDGTRAGYDVALTRAVADAVDIPVIASGGVGTLAHLFEGVSEGRADAVLAASIFHFGEFTVAQAKEYLAGRGVPVRRVTPQPPPDPAVLRAASVAAFESRRERRDTEVDAHKVTNVETQGRALIPAIVQDARSGRV